MSSALSEDEATRPAETYAFPLSFAQRRLWFLHQMAPGNPFYNLHAAVPFTMPLDVGALGRALNEVVRRHEALRTTFGMLGGEPVQFVAPELALDLPVIGLEHLRGADQEGEVLRLATEESQRPFDLSHGPLIRTALLRRSPTSHVFLLTIHHIVADGWSIGILSRELAALYSAFVMGLPSPLPELPIQYPDFAVWQRDWLKDDVLREQLGYWESRLADVPTLMLPTDRRRPDISTYRGASHPIQLPPSLAGALKALGHREGCTLFMTLMAAFMALLSRYSGQGEVVVGSPIANRNRAELEGLIGFFVNSLVFRTDLGDDPSFRALMARVKETALGAYAHQDLPFEMLVEALQPERDLSRNPLFQVTFQLISTPAGGPRPSAAEGLSVQRGAAVFDLAFNLWETDWGIAGQLEYSTDLFDAATIARLAGHYRTLLEGVIEDPDLAVSALPLLTEGERRQLTVDWNQTAAEIPEVCVHRMVEEAAERSPDAPAVECGEGSLSYRELNERANRLAHYLRARAVGPGALVAVQLERSPELVISVLAIMKAGGAYVPLDPSCPRARLVALLNDAGAPLLVTRSGLAGAFAGVAAEIISIDADWGAIAREPDTNPGSGPGPEDLAYVIYTSGSTGHPKGAEVEHRSLTNLVCWHRSAFDVRPSDRATLVSNPAFDASVWELWPYLAAGASVSVADPKVVLSPPALCEFLASRGVTICFLPTPLAEVLLDAPWPSRTSLRYLLTGGDRLHQRKPVDLPFELVNNYGPTECTVVATSGPVDFRERSAAGPPIGRPIANTRAYVLDARMAPVPIGVAGELYLGGAGLARGYLHRPDLTAAAFVPDPFASSAGGRLYRTGDVVRYRPDATLEFLGRRDEQVKIHGVRIELGEVEAAARAVPGVREAVAAAADDGPGGCRLVAYVVPEADASTDVVGDDGAPAPGLALVDHWRDLYEGVYREGAAADPAFDTRGWNSSDTGAAIPEPEMREWVEHTVARLRRGRPRRVLEVGCGTALLLYRLAPTCDAYVGVDFSETVVQSVREHCDRLGLDRVRLRCGRADDLAWLAGERFDTAVLNSVVQYFPGVNYLTGVLEAILDHIEPGGRIFLGDVRNRDLLEAFHASIELGRCGEDVRLDELRERVGRRVAQEAELLISPSFFPAVARRLGRISRVQLELKRGRYGNEMTRFRYDVTLHVEGGPESSGPSVTWERWPGLEDVGRRLEGGSEAFGFGPVANARVEAAIRAGRLLAESEGWRTAGWLRGQLSGPCEGVDPEAVWELAESHGYRAEIGWRDPAGAEAGRFEAMLMRGVDVAGDPPGDVGLSASWAGPDRPWREYANDPLRGGGPSGLSRLVREAIRQRLPEAYVPSAVVVLERLPLTRNGKVDRAALPRPEPDHRHSGRAGVPSKPRTPWERRLAQIWREVLRVDDVGIHDNFFELGGDSILSIQIIARASQAGIRLTPAQMFQHKTIAELSAVAEEGAPAPSGPRGPVSGPFVLTPIHRWFFEQGLEDPHHFNQSVLLPVPASVAYAPLGRAFDAIFAHHDALRLRFAKEGTAWRAFHAGPDERAGTVEHQDLSAIPERELGAAIRESSGRLQASLNLAEGPLVRVKAFTRGPTGPAYLLIVIHHLVVDGVSWRILMEDLATALGQIGRGEDIRLPPKSASFQDWAENLAVAARSEDLRREAGYWLGDGARVDPLPVDFPGDANLVESARDVTVTLAAAPTRSILQDVHSAYQTRINDVLLTALVRAFAAWTGRPHLLVDLEGHGREDIPGAPDVSRTVGWFTSLFPVHLRISGREDPTEDLKAVKEQLRRIPRHGIGYGLLRYLAGDEDLGRRLAALPVPEVAFNYFGQFAGGGLAATGGEVEVSWAGPVRSPRGRRRHLIEVNATVAGDVLSVTWTYAENIHRRETIEAIAARFLDELGGLVAGCLSPGAGGYTPSDFANAGLGQEELDRFIAGIDQPRKAARRTR